MEADAQPGDAAIPPAREEGAPPAPPAAEGAQPASPTAVAASFDPAPAVVVPTAPAPENAALALARGALRLADHVATSEDPVQDLGRTISRPQALVLAYGLYRDALLWALVGDADRASAAGVAGALASAPREQLVAAAGTEAALAAIEQTLAGTARFQSLDERTRRRELDALARFARQVVISRSAIDVVGLAKQRRRLIYLAVAALIGVVALAMASALPGILHPDFAQGAKWRASSAIGKVPGRGTEQKLQRKLGPLFFHTKEEEEPWILFDLGVAREISKVDVRNRADCCTDRAVPLVVETSTDGKTFTRVAEKKEKFVDWTASFDKTNVRWVRLRVAKKTSLHLEKVEIR